MNQKNKFCKYNLYLTLIMTDMFLKKKLMNNNISHKI